MSDNIPDFIPVLSHGGHKNPKDGACVMEMVSYIAGEHWTDRPDCVHEVIQEIARNVNDFVSDDNRNVITEMIPRFIGTDKIKGKKRLTQLTAEKMQAHPDMARWTVPGTENSVFHVRARISDHFHYETDINKRFTNEEYDKFAMTILEVILDAADEILERGNYEVTKEEAFAKVAELPSQRKVSNV